VVIADRVYADVYFIAQQAPQRVEASTAPSLKLTSKTLYIGYNTYNIGIDHLAAKHTVTYKSLNEKIAVVSKKGKVTPVAPGTVGIVVSIKQNNKTYKDTLKVTVKKPYVKISEWVDQIQKDNSVQFIAKVYGSKEKITWKVSNKEIATIDEKNGFLTALDSGTITVTATAGTLEHKVQVTVNDPRTKEYSIEGSSEIVVGDVVTYTVSGLKEGEYAMLYPEDESCAEPLAYSNAGCTVAAIKAGTFTLIVESDTGHGKKTVKVKDLQIVGNTSFGVAETSAFKLTSERAMHHTGWKLGDSSIAEWVDGPSGSYYLLGKREGSTTLTVEYIFDDYCSLQNYSVSVPIYIGKAPDFAISGGKTISVGCSDNYTVNLPNNTEVNWTISDNGVASVRGYGTVVNVLANRSGTVTLTANYGSKTAQYEITITGDDSTDFADNTNESSEDPSSKDDTIADNTNTSEEAPDTTSASSKKVTKNGVIYELRDTYAYVAGVNSGTTSAAILSEVEGLPVTRIGKGFGQSSGLKTVTWTGNNITIEEKCFEGNTSLTSVDLKGGQIYIGSSAFGGCTALSSVQLSGEVKKVGNVAFSGCTALTSLTIPGSETIYDVGYYGPFYGCGSLKVLRLESKVVFSAPKNEQYFLYGIWKDTDAGCKIEELYLNIDQITTSRLLQYLVPSLRKLTLVNTRSICRHTIYDSQCLEEIILPDTLTTIPEWAFASNDKLWKVNIPDTVMSIEDTAFGYCYNLTTVDAEVNRDRILEPEEAFRNTRFGSIQGCYLNGAANILSSEEYAILQKAISVVDSVKASGTGDYHMIKECHDWIVSHTVYDYENYLNDTVPESSYKVNGIFLYGTAVCDGYAKTFQMLMELAGIECYRVIGFGSFEPHAWNIVKLGGAYYQIDCTWDDPVPDTGEIYYDYFLRSDLKMGGHQWDNSMNRYPSCPEEYTADDEVIKQLELDRFLRQR